MPAETPTPHPDYVKGFNEGYLIAQHLPDLAAKLPSNIAGERGQGFMHGRQQFEHEKFQSLQPDWLRKDRLSKQSEKNTPAPQKTKGPDAKSKDR